MPRRFVRDSKFRHVFGSPFKRQDCYEDIQTTKNVWDGGKYCAVNSKFVAIVLDGCGGGTFLVLPIEETGRLKSGHPRFEGHSGKVLDIKFNPFNANILASAGEDSRVKIWNIPDGGITENVTKSVIDLVGHRKKVGIIQWHPTAENVLASAGFDYDIIVWDVKQGQPVHLIKCHDDVINAMVWNVDGSRLATTSKDKYGRIIDPRNTEEENGVEHKFFTHSGSKPVRIHFMDNTRVITVGTQASSGREIALWNTNDMSEEVIRQDVDEGSSGNMITEFDYYLKILYIAAKGETTIKYFEVSYDSPYFHYLNQYQSSTTQRGFGVLPKHALEVNKCEVARLYKLDSKGIEPISMIVPRKSDCFQEDIYPNVPGDTPALTADQWFAGGNADPNLVSMKDGFVATKKEFTAEVSNTQEENIFAVGLKTAPQREEDLRKSFYQQQDELRDLRELLKGKELKIRQLEYENNNLKKKSHADSDDCSVDSPVDEIKPEINA